ncbi:hypothetical protein [Thermoflavimicrobium dichotomicum]|uniref:Uncharacterized protein n=1 Tax=Thermoflavimicrobium dichotomicum TaxID=46223 RepID=A0A1I3T3U5_9BACL|nr:hypothetical protein [Thermoflavimicrobium dichotomicum]SFJ64346.1 hypothetical protein SAMN05421852_11510 [Thermoflavimicrobium dichotomicum]
MFKFFQKKKDNKKTLADMLEKDLKVMYQQGFFNDIFKAHNEDPFAGETLQKEFRVLASLAKQEAISFYRDFEVLLEESECSQMEKLRLLGHKEFDPQQILSESLAKRQEIQKQIIQQSFQSAEKLIEQRMEAKKAFHLAKIDLAARIILNQQTQDAQEEVMGKTFRAQNRQQWLKVMATVIMYVSGAAFVSAVLRPAIDLLVDWWNKGKK